MSWRGVFGLDGVEFVLFWAGSIVTAILVGVASEEPAAAMSMLVLAAFVYAVLRRRALRGLPAQDGGKLEELVAQLQDEQSAASEFFERRIAELEERVDFAERMLARGQEERLEAGRQSSVISRPLTDDP